MLLMCVDYCCVLSFICPLLYYYYLHVFILYYLYHLDKMVYLTTEYTIICYYARY